MIDRYILNANGEPVPCPDLMKWGAWFGNGEGRIVAKTAAGGSMVSTVFLGLDHNFCGDGPPILWETMIFNGPHDGWQNRYASRQAAYDDHQRIVRLLQGGKNPDDDEEPPTGRKIVL